jgi:hypothetical protein
LPAGAAVTVAGAVREIVRRSGTDQRPILRLDGCETRESAEALRGEALLVARDSLPALGEDEWWPEQLEGCRVRDGERTIGVVTGVRALPSCEVLEVARETAGSSWFRSCATPCAPSTSSAATSTWTWRSSRVSDADRRLHPVPRLVRLVRGPAPRRQRARRRSRAALRAPTAITAS